MSPYLHFGQISPLYIALKVTRKNGLAKDAYLEELIVRRELSMNFVFYNEKYDSFRRGDPSWAQKTLKAHQRDKRPYLYSLEELESAKTHDPYWNAAQKEMVFTGKMHGYMRRMYWGKKILEWSKTLKRHSARPSPSTTNTNWTAGTRTVLPAWHGASESTTARGGKGRSSGMSGT